LGQNSKVVVQINFKSLKTMKVFFIALSLFIAGVLMSSCDNSSMTKKDKDSSDNTDVSNTKITSHKDKSKPNIVFIIADDMYPHMFNNLIEDENLNYEPNLTPTLDKLIKEGVWLDNIKVVSPLCSPSRYNCLTGLYASRATNKGFVNKTNVNNGQKTVQWNTFIVPGQEKTMGTYFQELGYKTGFVGKNHVIDSITKTGIIGKPDFNADPNNPKVKEILDIKYKALQNDIKNSGFDYADALYHNNPDWSGLKALSSHNLDWITEKGLEFIESSKDNPFMLYFASTVPHGPKAPQKSWRSNRRKTSRGILKESPDVLPKYEGKLSKKQEKLISEHPSLERSVRNFVSIDKRLKENGLSGADKANLLWLDDSINALLEKLKEIGAYDNTILVFFNDHGQDLKGTLYEGGINSEAFIWKKGGFKVGKTLENPVSNVDFLPTLLELAGSTEHKEEFDGYSFKPALIGEEYQERKALYFELGYARAIVKDNFKYYAVRYPEWAYSLTYEQRKNMLDQRNNEKEKFGRPTSTSDPMDPFGHLVMVPGGEKLEKHAYSIMPHYFDENQLYDLSNDPEEKINLADDPAYSETYKELQELLRMELARLSDNFIISKELTQPEKIKL
jgi:arylsulfatase A-like enzyme